MLDIVPGIRSQAGLPTMSLCYPTAAAAPSVREELLSLPGMDHALALRWSLPASAAAPAALVLHLHAGAFVAGSPAEGARVAAVLAAEGALVASLGYPLAPQRPFPEALEAVHAALLWLHRQRRKLQATGLPLLLAGEEAGGNLAAAAALAAHDRGAPPLHGQILLSPMLDVCTGTASQRHAQADAVHCPWAEGWRQYLSCASDVLHPYAAPGRALRLGGLPPALLVSAADDPLRDETRAYAARLREAGVAVSEALLDAPTGWPASYRNPAPAPWAEALRPHVRAFMQACAGARRPLHEGVPRPAAARG
jgi:acetyl esterase/lipase